MIKIRTIYSIIITLCWSMIVLVYVVSHKQVVTHVVKLKCINRGCNTSVGQDKEHQMCLLHFSNASCHVTRVVRNTDDHSFLPAVDYWKKTMFVTGFRQTLFLYFRQIDFNLRTADRIILFQQIRI